MASFWRFAPGIVLMALAGGSLGCSQQPGSISGEVTINGKPVPRGVISFHSEDGTPVVTNAPIMDGRYAVSGVPAGNVIVTVGNPSPKGAMVGGLVPRQYADPDTSTLTLIVQPGEQTHHVALTP